jgi:ABC-type glycerol-3-phosphate transport system substrate-binding protein
MRTLGTRYAASVPPAAPRSGATAPTATRRSLLTYTPLAIGALSGAAIAAACGRSADGGAAPAPNAVQGKVTVLSWQTASPKWDLQQQLYTEFNAKHQSQGLSVDFVNPGQDVAAKATTLHVAGTPADMWEFPRLWRELEGMNADLSTLYRRDKIDLGQWIPDAINVLKQGDKIWGMPISISADAMAVNLDLYAAAGLQPPPQNPDDRSWTMDAFLENARKLTKNTDQFGYGGPFTGGVSKWLDAPAYFGYGPVDLAGKKVTLNTPGFQQGLQFWADMATKYHFQPYGDESKQLLTVPNQNIFTTGKVAASLIYNLAERPTFRWAVAALPYTPSPQQPRNASSRISVHSLYMDADSKHKDQAWEVFKYWMRPENDARWVLSDGHVVPPLVKGAFDITAKDYQDHVGADPKAFFLQAQRSKVDGWGFFLLKDWAKAAAEIDPLWTKVTAGQMTVSDFAAQAQSLTERIASF